MGILRPASSTRRKTALGNFRFSKEVTVKNNLTSTEELTSKAPCQYETFITIRTPALEEGGNIGKKFVPDTIHAEYEYLWEVYPTIVLYPYPGKIQHSVHVLPYKKKHTRVPQSKRHRKLLLYRNLNGIQIRSSCTVKCARTSTFLLVTVSQFLT